MNDKELCTVLEEMDNTLDTIRQSSDATLNEEVSYLYGRDPSIISYGQQRFITKDSQKNLYSLYEEEESHDVINSESLSSQTVKVYLRMKPFPKKMKLSKEQEEAYSIVNSTTLITKMANMECNASCLKRPKSSDTICKKFTFSQTFGPDTSQYDLFEQVIQSQMVDFLAGQNATVMTYGTTNSGKSFTLQGTTSSPGIIPRALEFIFSNINPKATPCYKPINHSDVIALDNKARGIELERKTCLLTFGSADKNLYINAYKEMQSLLQEQTAIRQSTCPQGFYSVWISFAEIYNETIYDLLSNDIQARRPPLKLSTDSQGRSFIKGLKTVCVNSGSEAYQILMAGQYNLKVAATALNARSSRSHCIFTVTLLKYSKENSPDSVEVSTFAFCDLAGSERLKKTLNEGERLKEAQNINTSLLVLGRCLKSVYETQGTRQKTNLVGPFRESKLTRLFQRPLSGNENIALIVNVNPSPNLYIETQNVLNFSAIAKKIIIEPKKIPRKKSISRFSKIVSQSIKTVTDWDTMDFENTDELDSESEPDVDMVHREDYDDAIDEIKNLKQEVLNLKNTMVERDMAIRQELTDTYSQMMKKIEHDWRNRVKDVEEQHEDQLEYSLNRLETYYKEKINKLKSSRKRTRLETDDLEDDEDEDQKYYDEIEDENTTLKSKIETLKETIKNLRELKDKEVVEKTKIAFELSVTKDDLKNAQSLLESANTNSSENDKKYIQEIKTQLDEAHEKNKQLKVFLNEAKEEFITITTDCRLMEEKLKTKEEILVEYEDKINELEHQLEIVNDCLSEKVKFNEILEDNIETKNRIIADLQDDILNMKEKQHVRNNIMHSEKETMTCEELSSIDDNKSQNSLSNTSCQTETPNLIDSECNTNFSEIKTNSSLSTEEKILQTSFLDQQDDISAEFEKLKETFAQLEIESIANKMHLEESAEKITKLEMENKNLEEAIKQSLEEHEETMKEMQKILDEAKEKDNTNLMFLEEYKETVADLEKEKKRLEEAVKQSQEEEEAAKKEIQRTLDNAKEKDNFKSVFLEEFKEKSEELEKENKKLESKLEEMTEDLERVSKERDTEIASLQNELKQLIRSKETLMESHDRENEKQIKLTLKALRATEDTLTKEQEKCKILQRNNERLEQEVRGLEDTIKDTYLKEEMEREIVSLKGKIETFTNEIQQRQIEFEKFAENRDDTIKRYENLVSTLQSDVEREKKEKSRLQDLFQKHSTPTPSKDEIKKLKKSLEIAQEQVRAYEEEKLKDRSCSSQRSRRVRRRDKENCENTSDDEVSYPERRKRSPRGIKIPTPMAESSIIEVSSTESKRQTRMRTVLAPPDPLPVVEKKRTINRRKKLFQQDDDVVDLVPCENASPPAPSPLTASRNLRARKK
ncbi:kinesin-like protein KIF20A isoform X2 [Leptopilina heterotoma]|uniref:kinesin-like protein KIF20A isoform X2 n=1 Tax=Leptopilina heterotoma TaxID=63436 RepID=UPI001CA80800|nr:kinesin-like protein KIF20A isoform X2 [Leptopilina heterotoma]